MPQKYVKTINSKFRKKNNQNSYKLLLIIRNNNNILFKIMNKKNPSQQVLIILYLIPYNIFLLRINKFKLLYQRILWKYRKLYNISFDKTII